MKFSKVHLILVLLLAAFFALDRWEKMNVPAPAQTTGPAAPAQKEAAVPDFDGSRAEEVDERKAEEAAEAARETERQARMKVVRDEMAKIDASIERMLNGGSNAKREACIKNRDAKALLKIDAGRDFYVRERLCLDEAQKCFDVAGGEDEENGKAQSTARCDVVMLSLLIRRAYDPSVNAEVCTTAAKNMFHGYKATPKFAQKLCEDFKESFEARQPLVCDRYPRTTRNARGVAACKRSFSFVTSAKACRALPADEGRRECQTWARVLDGAKSKRGTQACGDDVWCLAALGDPNVCSDEALKESADKAFSAACDAVVVTEDKSPTEVRMEAYTKGHEEFQKLLSAGFNENVQMEMELIDEISKRLQDLEKKMKALSDEG